MTHGRGVRGVILVLALVYLFLLALVAAAVLKSAALHVRMAGNDQFAAAAEVRARAVAREVSRYPANFDAGMAAGAVRCVLADADSGCDAGGLAALPATLAGANIDYRVVRRAPLELAAVPLAVGEEGDPHERFALFEVQVRVGDSAAGAEAMRGVILGLTPGAQAGELYGVYWRFPATDPL